MTEVKGIGGQDSDLEGKLRATWDPVPTEGGSEFSAVGSGAGAECNWVFKHTQAAKVDSIRVSGG